jgi:DNA-binding transcriptional regulator YdaS (Cro superfamily)
MDKLLSFLNRLTAPERGEFCILCGTTVGYLRKAVSVGHLLSPALCVSIERSTGGAVTRRDLRPDDWQDIWPELAGDGDAATTTAKDAA